MGIITLLIINSTISFIEENNAGNAAAALMASLAPKAKVFNLSFFFRYVDVSVFVFCIFIFLRLKLCIWEGMFFVLYICFLDSYHERVL